MPVGSQLRSPKVTRSSLGLSCASPTQRQGLTCDRSGVLHSSVGAFSFPTGRVGLALAGGEPLWAACVFCPGNSASVIGPGPPPLLPALSQIRQKLGKWVARGDSGEQPLPPLLHAVIGALGIVCITAQGRAGLSLRRHAMPAALARAPPRVVRRWPSRLPLGGALPFTTVLVTFSRTG